MYVCMYVCMYIYTVGKNKNTRLEKHNVEIQRLLEKAQSRPTSYIDSQSRTTSILTPATVDHLYLPPHLSHASSVRGAGGSEVEQLLEQVDAMFTFYKDALIYKY